MRRNELYHHGVKGQKWGIRRMLNKLRRGTHSTKPSKPKVVSEDYAKKRAASRKSLDELSNKEISEYITRTTLEQKYNSIHPSTIDKGIAFVAKATSVANTAYDAYKTYDKIKKVISTSSD